MPRYEYQCQAWIMLAKSDQLVSNVNAAKALGLMTPGHSCSGPIR
jgi:hypothetical protein